MMTQVQTDTLHEWQQSAKYWKKHSPTIHSMFAPLTRALIEEAGIKTAHLVLDVAGGAGEPSLTIAGVVGPTGSVMCTDAVEEMVIAALDEAHERGIENIDFRQCTADSLPFPNDSFDVVVSRLGAMFFPEPLDALREMLRVTKPGGTLAFAVWHKSELNPYSYLVTQVLSRYVEVSPADPDAPDAFRFAQPGKLAAILKKSGATDISERIFKFQIEAPISVEEFWAMRSEISEILREKLKTLTEAQCLRVAQEVQDNIRQFFSDDGMSFPAEMIIVSGRKPK
ncbi:MAG TPA: class I SAM-dependent methyltransferase [Pyrinomonadaceae bacterium]|jgi:ubiquinone/menaquinone biosynthesis C-methylase UbiE|nr:class I SAM-dependent methyltransferase [Pyrinomonadaceae bacterium]